MDCSAERDILSGMEPLQNSEVGTLHRSSLSVSNNKEESFNSVADKDHSADYRSAKSPDSSPIKLPSEFSSPIVAGDASSFSTAAQDITKRLQESLASSLKLEKEAEACLSASLKKNRSSSIGRNSTPHTPLSISPSKYCSPSKLKVRFEDELILSTDDLQPKFEANCVRNSPKLSGTPVKSSREDFVFDSSISDVSPIKKCEEAPAFGFSPTKKSSDVDAVMMKPPENNIEPTFFDSLKLPQNDYEREKLLEFMNNMKTSGAADPLASLFNLEYDLRLSDLSMRANTPENKLTKPKILEVAPPAPKEREKDAGFQLKRRKPDVKRNLVKKDFGKKTTKPKSENSNKMAVGKKGMQTKKGTGDAKVSKTSKKGKSNSEPKPAAFTAEGQKSIGSMETIRNHLQGMLKMDGALVCTPEVSADYKVCFGEGDGENVGHSNEPPDSFRSSDTATLLSAKPDDFVPSVSSSDATSDNVEALIDSATSSIFNLLKGSKTQQPTMSSNSTVDPSMTVEINILRDTLEKERYRRSHCEKQIYKLQNRILEIQQELAVGQSVTRKKDMMIEQLDKTLGKVVGGWKNHEQKLVTSVQQLTEEKAKLMSEIKKKNEMIGDLKMKFNKAMEELASIREKLQLKEEEQKLLQQTFQLKTHEISRVIDQKNASIEKLLNDKQTMVADINKLTQRIEEIEENTEEEKEKFSQDLLKQKNKLEEQLKKEKAKSQTEKNRNSDMQKMLSSTQEEVSRLEELMGSLRQTIDNLKMQGSVEEAKFAAAIRKIEAEHQIEMEKKVTEKLTKFHEEAEEKERDLRDNHHKQVMEITSNHQNELESQCKMYQDRIEQLERRAREEMELKDRKFVELLKEKTEGMRQQMMGKMQNLLQAHYNETLEVVGNTTGNTPLRQSRMGVMPSLFGDLRSSNFMTGSKLQDISNLTASTMTFSDTISKNSAALHKSFASGNPTNHVTAQKPVPSSLPTGNIAHHPSITSELTSSTFSVFNTVPQVDLPAITTGNDHQKRDASNILNTSVMSLTSESSAYQTKTDALAKEQASQNSENPIEQHTYEAEINLPISTLATPVHTLPSADMNDVDRKQCLQHYIKMLLDRSPGDPLEAPQPTAPVNPLPPPSISDLSPILEPSKANSDGNKENDDGELNLPKHATSEIALEVLNFLNKQLNSQPSPDVIPVGKSQMSNPPQKQSKASNPKQTQRFKNSAFSHVKVGAGKLQGKNANHINQGSNKSPRKQDLQQLTVKDLDTKQDLSRSYSGPTEQQVSDVSRMLGSYMNGDTQEAAEKLLSYLAESQRKGMHEIPLNSSLTSKTKGKSKTPSKGSLPAWR